MFACKPKGYFGTGARIDLTRASVSIFVTVDDDLHHIVCGYFAPTFIVGYKSNLRPRASASNRLAFYTLRYPLPGMSLRL
jgi:hypothetical protein